MSGIVTFKEAPVTGRPWFRKETFAPPTARKTFKEAGLDKKKIQELFQDNSVRLNHLHRLF